jgi:Lon-like ATP-dependent protease
LKEKYDIYVQFLQTYEGVEGDSASISVATAIISAVAELPIKQNTALTGSLSVRGEVLPVGGVTAKVEAAIEAGMKKVIVPKANFKDVILPKGKENKIEVIPAANVVDVLEHAIVWKGKQVLLKKLKKL